MVGPLDEPPDARDRDGKDRRHDQQQAPAQFVARPGHPYARLTGLAALLLTLILPLTATAERIRIATYNTELSRKGPGLMLRDILKGEDPQVVAVLGVIDAADADVLVLQSIDWDHEGAALGALNAALDRPYAYSFARRPNAGMMTRLDLDGDGRLGQPGDAQGYGSFAGAGGMAVLSRFPLGPGARDFSALLWRDLPGATLPEHPDGAPFPSAEAQAAQRLSSVGHWAVPVEVAEGRLVTLLTYHASPPVFDGPEDRNGLRSADETRLWQAYLTGKLDAAPPTAAIVLAGDTNLDPSDGDGRGAILDELLDTTVLTDPAPRSAGGAQAAAQGGANATHRGDPALDTADWRDDPGPGNLRVDYLLPSEDLTVKGSGVLWPPPEDPFAETVRTASRHRLLWLDIEF